MKKLLTIAIVIVTTSASAISGDYGTTFSEDFDQYQRQREQRRQEQLIEDIERRIRDIENANYWAEIDRIRKGNAPWQR